MADLSQIIGAIYLGNLDENLDELFETIMDRRKKLGQKFQNDLETGDVVMFSNTISPKYIRGMHAEIVTNKRTKIVVRMLDGAGRFPKGSLVTTQGSSLKLVMSYATEAARIKERYG